MANISVLLFSALVQVNWIDFYIIVDGELILDSFQGKVACIRIPLGVGIFCNTAQAGTTQRIDDVYQYSL